MTKDRGPRAQGGELAIIECIRRRAEKGAAQHGELRLGIGDDCAILHPRKGEELVVTTDFSLEGRHFRRDWHRPEFVGHRALARGLSDLAAMGARPVAAFLSLALPQSVARDGVWLEAFLDGLLGLARRAKVPLAGGDTSEAPSDHVLIDIVLLGAVARGKALRRAGGRAGDRLFVTGELGGAAAELESLAADKSQMEMVRSGTEGQHPHLLPEPRLAVGQALVRRGLASAAMDLSDGLSSDLQRLCEASGVAAEVEAARLPLHGLLADRSEPEVLAAALHGGEDYELLFAAPEEVRVPKQLAGVRVTEIGRLLEPRRDQPRVRLVEAGGRVTALEPGGWEHLR